MFRMNHFFPLFLPSRHDRIPVQPQGQKKDGQDGRKGGGRTFGQTRTVWEWDGVFVFDVLVTSSDWRL